VPNASRPRFTAARDNRETIHDDLRAIDLTGTQWDGYAARAREAPGLILDPSGE